MLLSRIKALSEAYAPDTVANRRHIHQNPELSFQENETCSFVAGRLKEYGLKPQAGVAGTGVVVTIEGKKGSGPTVALRADMDALPILEANEVPYKSRNAGIMHACGHDAHTASLLTTARILNELKDDLEGTYKLIFQPGEEKIPGGASLMIAEGVLQNPTPAHILGQHVMPFLPAGTIGFREGMYMASADEIYVTVRGKGGHGAMPEKSVDPVLIACNMVVALQQVVSRMASPKMPSVLTFGKITGGTANNIIPNEVKLEGTFRTLDEDWRADAHARMKKLAVGLCESMGAECEFEIMRGYPFLKNDPEVTRRARAAAEAYMGAENVVDLDLWMAAEDFAWYTHQVPGCFYRLGTGNAARGITSGVHTPTFDIDEEALKISPGLMAWMAVASK